MREIKWVNTERKQDTEGGTGKTKSSHREISNLVKILVCLTLKESSVNKNCDYFVEMKRQITDGSYQRQTLKEEHEMEE